MASTRYRKTYKLFNTAQEAENFCAVQNRNAYLRKNHPAFYTPVCLSAEERAYVSWYYTK